MEKIKFITDSPSDIPDKDLQRYNIEMAHVPITIDGESYFERKSFTIQEFHKILAEAKEIPTTSRILPHDFQERYARAYNEGYNIIICVTLNARGSAINASAHEAKQAFFEENPDAAGKIEIHVVDSATYSIAYGYAIVQAAKMVDDGRSAKEILSYLSDWFGSVDVYLGCYNLTYAKRSGRITAAAAFVGDMLGLRPIILMRDGTTNIMEKVRGEQNLIPRIFEHYKKNRISRDTPVVVAYGSNKEYGRRLRAMIEEDIGRAVPMHPIGAAILINSGPDMVGMACMTKRKK